MSGRERETEEGVRFPAWNQCCRARTHNRMWRGERVSHHGNGVGGCSMVCLRFILHEEIDFSYIFLSSSNLALSWLLNNSLHCSNLCDTLSVEFCDFFRAFHSVWYFSSQYWLGLNDVALNWSPATLFVWNTIRFSVSLQFMFDAFTTNYKAQIVRWKLMNLRKWKCVRGIGTVYSGCCTRIGNLSFLLLYCLRADGWFCVVVRGKVLICQNSRVAYTGRSGRTFNVVKWVFNFHSTRQNRFFMLWARIFR